MVCDGGSAGEQAVRDELVARRARAAAQIAELTRSFDAIVESSVGANADDEHDPEGSTIGFERAQVAALLEQAKAHRADIDDALGRLDDGTYGTCDRCGGRIAAERLAALPAARTCITCANAVRRQRS